MSASTRARVRRHHSDKKKPRKCRLARLFEVGGASGTRTPDLRIMIPQTCLIRVHSLALISAALSPKPSTGAALQGIRKIRPR